MAPNLGWRDVPLGACLATALGPHAPWPSGTRRTSVGSPSCGAGRRAAWTDVLYVTGEVGVGGNLISRRANRFSALLDSRARSGTWS